MPLLPACPPHLTLSPHKPLNLSSATDASGLSWHVPDPNCIHYPAICEAAKGIAAKFFIPPSKVHLWIDYCSVDALSNRAPSNPATRL